MLHELAAWIVPWLRARGQAPSGGFFLQFAELYGPRTSAGLSLACFGLAVLVGFVLQSRSRRAQAAPGSGAQAIADRSPHEFFGACLVLGIGLWLWFEFGVLRGSPRAPDESTYLFLAELLQAGWASAPAPDSATLEAASYIPFSRIHQGRWIGAFLPGWPLLLAPFQKFGLSALLRFSLWGANLLLLFGWLRRHNPLPIAYLGTALACLSPFWIAIHASSMADPLGLFLGFQLVAALESKRLGWAGAFAGWLLLVRPANLFFAAGVFLLAKGTRSWRGAARILGGALPFAFFLATWNLATTGHALVTPYQLAAPRAGLSDGLSLYQGMQIRHDLATASLNLFSNAWALRSDLLGLPGLTWPLLLLGFFGSRGSRSVLWGGVLAMGIGYGFYFHPGMAYGPRFYLLATPWLFRLVAHGLSRVAEALRIGVFRFSGILLLACLPISVSGIWMPLSLTLERYSGTDPRPQEVALEALARVPGRLLVLVPAMGYPEAKLIYGFRNRIDPSDRLRVRFVEDPRDPNQVRIWAKRTGRTPIRLPLEGAPFDQGQAQRFWASPAGSSLSKPRDLLESTLPSSGS